MLSLCILLFSFSGVVHILKTLLFLSKKLVYWFQKCGIFVFEYGVFAKVVFIDFTKKLVFVACRSFGASFQSMILSFNKLPSHIFSIDGGYHAARLLHVCHSVRAEGRT